MFGAVIITFVITALLMLVMFFMDSAKKQSMENERLRKGNERLNQQVSDLICQRNTRRERDAYNQGLYDGRATDTLYRKMLSKYSAGEQATVMMYGEETAERRN